MILIEQLADASFRLWHFKLLAVTVIITPALATLALNTPNIVRWMSLFI